MVYDVAVIGGGPAGASAALFAAKAGKKTLLIDADKGMTRRAMVYNFYGMPEIRGPDLVDTGHRQAAHFGAELIKAAVTDVKKTEDGFRVVTEQGDFQARYVILATGATADLASKIGLDSKPATEPRIKTVLVVDPAGQTNIPGIWNRGRRQRSCRRDCRRRRPGGHQCDQPDQRRPLGRPRCTEALIRFRHTRAAHHEQAGNDESRPARRAWPAPSAAPARPAHASTERGVGPHPRRGFRTEPLRAPSAPGTCRRRHLPPRAGHRMRRRRRCRSRHLVPPRPASGRDDGRHGPRLRRGLRAVHGGARVAGDPDRHRPAVGSSRRTPRDAADGLRVVDRRTRSAARTESAHPRRDLLGWARRRRPGPRDGGDGSRHHSPA